MIRNFITPKYETFSSRAENSWLLESPSLFETTKTQEGETSNENSAEFLLFIRYVQTFICGAEKENISHFCEK